MHVRSFRPALVATTLALALSACSGAGSDGAGAGDRDGDRLRYAYAFTPVDSLSPYSDDSVTTYGVGATETLVRLDERGELQPLLATDWTEIDPLTWEITLENGVTFHDGTDMTAEVVAASLNNAATAEPSPRTLTGVDFEATAGEGSTVTVVTTTPDPTFPQRLTSPELAILAPGAYADEPNSPDPIGFGTGPYEITELDGTSEMHLDAFDDYWGGEPGLEGIDVSFIAEGDSRASALRSGQADVAWALPPAQIDQLDADELITIPLPRTVSIHLTETSTTFADPGLRAAAAEAVKDLDLAGTIYGGHVTDADGAFFSPEVSAWAADRPEATLPAVTEPSGQKISLATFSDRSEMTEIATVVADAWRSAGFDVTITVQEYNQLETQFLDGTFDAVIMSRSYAFETADPISFLQTDFGCEGTYNISLFCDATVDQTLAEAATSSDTAERERVAIEVETTLLSDVTIIPLIHDAAQIGVSPRVSGLARDPYERSVVTVETTLD